MKGVRLPTLDFPTFDDIALAQQNGAAINLKSLTLTATQLGPILEWHFYREALCLPSLNDAAIDAAPEIQQVLELLLDSSRDWQNCITNHSALFKLHDTSVSQERLLTQIQVTVNGIVKAASESSETANLFIAAVSEMASNAIEHSNYPESAIICIAAFKSTLEFVVLDMGIGALESLRQNSAYQQVQDHDSALKLMIQEGVSRFGPASKRGYGFRPFFTGLINNGLSLRIRSGASTLTIQAAGNLSFKPLVYSRPFIPGLSVSASLALSDRKPTP